METEAGPCPLMWPLKSHLVLLGLCLCVCEMGSNSCPAGFAGCLREYARWRSRKDPGAEISAVLCLNLVLNLCCYALPDFFGFLEVPLPGGVKGGVSDRSKASEIRSPCGYWI